MSTLNTIIIRPVLLRRFAHNRPVRGWKADDVYLPTSRISAEIAKRRCKPSVDFVKRQLLLGGLSYCLERRQSPVLLSRLPLEFCAKMNWWELFAFSKSWQSELGSQEGLTLPSKLSLLFLIWSPQSLAATYDAVRQGCASMMTRPLYLYTVPSKLHQEHALGIAASYKLEGRKMFLPSNFSNFCESRQKLKWTSHRFREG